MADPFEVRMRFTSQLQHLSASTTAAQKAANYALKNREMDEDLHSCILEQLERNSMNNRANIMYFIEHLCEASQREGHVEFVRMVQRDILRVVDAVAPGDGSGAANVRVVRRVCCSPVEVSTSMWSGDDFVANEGIHVGPSRSPSPRSPPPRHRLRARRRIKIARHRALAPLHR
jgi:hypothetical protein